MCSLLMMLTASTLLNQHIYLELNLYQRRVCLAVDKK